MALFKEKMKKCIHAEVKHVLREHNIWADVLSNLASMRKKGRNKFVIQETLPSLSIKKSTALLDINAIGDNDYWMTLVYNFLTTEELPSDQREANATKHRPCSYVLLEIKLHR